MKVPHTGGAASASSPVGAQEASRHDEFSLASSLKHSSKSDPAAIRRLLDRLIDQLTGWDSHDPPIAAAPLSRDHFDPERRDEGLDWPSTALTMVGRQRLHNLRDLLERTLRGGVPGDFVETGVWRGGASILARAVLAVHGVTDRKVILADSFEGLPRPDADRYPADALSLLYEHEPLAVSLDQVRSNFAAFDLLDDQVEFVPGWFRDTMPTLEVERIALLRLDGDMYESTIDPLVHLYDKVSPGGYVIVDDYNFSTPCKRAVHDFFESRRLSPTMHAIDRIGVYFEKE